MAQGNNQDHKEMLVLNNLAEVVVFFLGHFSGINAA
jgi:hypothetical protein